MLKIMLFYLHFWVLINFIGTIAQRPPIVSTSYGNVEGFSVQNAAVFLGIPYALPPIGRLRLMPPEKSKPWQGTLRATQLGARCMQIDIPTEFSVRTQLSELSEDCLYLNIFTPRLGPAHLPVMFFIHGGAYAMGGAHEYPTDGIVENFVNRGVVVVTINYRLNIFGFFTTMTPEIPGNYGLLDQILALKWVQSEIDKFGGDPNLVTIFGESAGAGSVSILTYSPLAKGLFSQSIAQSGTAFSPWALNGNSFVFSTASRDTADTLKCTTIDKWNSKETDGVLECLQRFPAQQLLQEAVKRFISQGNLGWQPLVDGVGGVLPDWPRNLAKYRLNKPMIVGTNRDEQANFYIGEFSFATGANLTVNNFTKESFNLMLEKLIAPRASYGENTGNVRDAIKDVYYRLKIPPIRTNDHLGWANATIQAVSGQNYFAGAVKDGENALKAGNPSVYYYSFDYISDGFPYFQNFKAVGHAHELYYLFRNMWQIMTPTVPWVYTQNDIQISELLGILWTNFAKTGDPTLPTNPSRVRWMPTTNDNPGQYLSISTRSGMRQHYRRVAAELFNKRIPEITGRDGPVFSGLKIDKLNFLLLASALVPSFFLCNTIDY